MNAIGMSFDEAAEVLEQMRLEATANNLSQQATAISIAIDCINNWVHYKKCVEDDLK